MGKMLAEWEKEMIRCIRCGACRSVCPVFKETGTESTVARGKIRLIRALLDGELEPTDGLAKRMSLCLACKTCTTYCPSGVKVDSLVRAARTHFITKKGMSLAKRFVYRFLLKNRGVFRSALKGGTLGQAVFFRKAPSGEGMLPRLPLGLDRRRLLAPLAPKPLLEILPERIPVQRARRKVAFFTGCMINYIYTDIGRATVEVLRKNGVEVILPRLQHCCGTPVNVSGDVETARTMAVENIKLFSGLDVDAVVTACASCGLALKREYPELVEDIPEYREKAKWLSEKAMDISRFILELDGYREGLGELREKVTYHDPCHLFHGLGVRAEPREIIRSVPGVDFLDIPVPTCCGSGGSFSLYHYDLTQKIADRKTQTLVGTGAEVVVTGCPACRMQLADAFFQKGIRIPVYHTVQFLERAYRAGKGVG